MSESEMTPATPAKPLAPWIGGKRGLAPRITAILDATPCATYCEVFVGMGGIFLRRTLRPKAEVINDFGGDVANLFRILQRHYVPFLDTLRWSVTSRHEFERLARVDPSTLTDLERAARFLYLQRTAFGGKVTERNFGVSPARPARFDLTQLAPMLEDVHARLAAVVIERLDFEACLARYDGPGTVFYLDPPYWDSEGDYGPELFGKADWARLVAALGRVTGRFLLSVNDTAETRALFAPWTAEAVRTTYTISSGGVSEAPELLVRNFEPTQGRLL